MFTTIKYPEGQGRQFIKFRYPAGEVQVRLTPAQIKIVQQSEKIQVIARITDGEIMELLQLLSAIGACATRAQKVQVILPYLPYGRADRRFVPGDCFGLDTFLAALDSQTGPQDDIITLDAHSNVGRDRYVYGFHNISPMPLINTAMDCILLDSKGTEHNLGILLPDEGSRKRYDFSQTISLNRLFNASKKRKITTGELIGFNVPPKEAFDGIDTVIVIDDLCDGGGTFIGIADAMKDYGKELYLYVTHGIFSKGTDELLKRYRKIYTTDSFRDPLGQSSVNAGSFAERVIFLPCLGTILDAINTRSELYENALQNSDSSKPGSPVLPARTEAGGSQDSDLFGSSLGGVYGNM